MDEHERISRSSVIRSQPRRKVFEGVSKQASRKHTRCPSVSADTHAASPSSYGIQYIIHYACHSHLPIVSFFSSLSPVHHSSSPSALLGRNLFLTLSLATSLSRCSAIWGEVYSSLVINPDVMDLPLYGPSRRTRGGGSNSSSSSYQVASCLVDGCNSDLSKCRDYHRRHKVCELHSKTPKVIIKGQEQRFCQQCSRFHSLVEFDDVKRSCRKRLDGHNRRRRKSQPESSLLNPTQFLSDFQDAAKYCQTTGPQVFPTSSTASCSWLGADDYFSSSSRHEITLNFSDKKQQTQFPFLQGTQQEPPTLLRAPSSSISTSGLESNGEGCGQGFQSNRALSLLSSLQHPHTEASPKKSISLFNNSQQLHHHHHEHYVPEYDRRIGMDHDSGVLVSQGGMFFQLRHDGSSSTPSSWDE